MRRAEIHPTSALSISERVLAFVPSGSPCCLCGSGGSCFTHLTQHHTTMAIKLIAGICTQNPALLISAAENYLAGIISTVSTFTYSVAPEVFFGASVTTALIGAGISYFLNRNKEAKALTKEVLYTSWRGFTVGGLGAISGYFAAGAFLGFACIQLGQLLAERDARHAILCCSCSAETYLVKLQIFGENPDFHRLWKTPQLALKSELTDLKVEDLILADDVVLRAECPDLKTTHTILKSAEIAL